MSGRIKYFISSTLINTFIGHSRDVINFKSGRKNWSQTLSLSKELFSSKEKFNQTIAPALNVSYVSSISNSFISSLLCPIVYHHYNKKSSSIVSNAKASIAYFTLSNLLLQPIDYVRYMIMAHKGIIPVKDKQNFIFKNTNDFVERTYISKGVGEFYRGLSLSMMKGIVGGATYGLINESLNSLFNNKYKKGIKNFFIDTLSLSATIGVVFPLEKMRIAYIADSLRSHRQYKNELDCMTKLIKQNGPVGCYKGICLVMIKGVVLNIIDSMLFKRYKSK